MKTKLIKILSAVMLCGCASKSSLPKVENTSEINQANFHFQEENAYGYYPGTAIFPARNKDYIFHVFATEPEIIYIENPNEKENKMTPYCDKAGCTHEDETCPAYIGEWTYIAFYKNKFYYTGYDENRNLFLKELDPSNNNRRIVYQWDRPANGEDSATDLIITYGNAIIRKDRWPLNIDTGEQQIVTETFLINLENGNCDLLAKDRDFQSNYSVIGGTEDKIIFTKYEIDNYMSLGDWISQGKSESSYYEEYIPPLDDHVALVSMDIKTKKEIVIAEAEDGFVRYSDIMNKIADDQLVYVKNDEIHLYDIRSEEDKIIYHLEEIRNYWIIDGKVLMLTSDKNRENLKEYIYDWQYDQMYILNNNGNTEYMDFGVDTETENGLISIVDRQWIKKTDFYNDNYDDIVTLW